jgi:ferritin-like metal-binding protein YciE
MGPISPEAAMNQKALKDLYVDELRDLYDSEQQLIKALPKMVKAAYSAELRSGFEQHLEQTKGHASRLEQILQGLGEPVKGKKCKGMQGIVAEGGEAISDGFEGPLMDAALISAAQRVEHYEIAGYGTVHAFALVLGEEEAASLLEQTLQEEKETDETLTQLSAEINPQAAEGGNSNAEAVDEAPKRKAAKAGGSR